MCSLTHSQLLQAIYRYSVQSADKTAIIAKGVSVSYALLWKNILGAAACLQSLGLEKGDCILLSGLKDVEFVYLYFAAHLLGLVNVIVDPTSNEERKKYIIETVRPKRVFGLKGGIGYSEVSLVGKPADIGLLSAQDIADIMFTTGTTGKPKGVLLSHANISGSANNINRYIGNTADDVEVLGLPICHSFGLGRLRCNMLLGATFILLGSFANLKLLFNTMEQYHVTGIGMVPAVWEYIKKLSGNVFGKFASQMSYIEIGSAAMSVENKRLLMEMFPNTRICMHYGLTEASRSLFMEFHEYADDLVTIGKPVTKEVDVKIFSDEGLELPIGESGELCIKGNMVMKSYLVDGDTVDSFWGEYFRTGDYAYKSENENFYLVSRKKEMINVGGKKVSPIEIEDAIIALGGVSDCICVAMKDPRGLVGEVPKVYVLREGTTKSLEEIDTLLGNKIENYKMPVKFEWIDKIPMTSSGKKQRLALCHN